ncbi:MAG: fimbrial biogenesis outer membrane usher protein [Gemmatimonadaceae bacterium]|nr:fimbrial biogenesis outer membrane usher protein [Gloeobacterales cyanobacterium ES-bin-141]
MNACACTRHLAIAREGRQQRALALTLGGVVLLAMFSGLAGKVLAQPSTPPSEEELFERAFGRSRTTRQPVPAQLSIDGKNQDEILVVPASEEEAVRLQATVLVQLAKLVQPETLERLRAAVDAEGNLTMKALRQNGLDALFDTRRLEVQIRIPPALRQPGRFDARAANLPREMGEALPPADLSGFVNLRAAQDFVWTGTSGTSTGRQPLRLGIDGALNWKGWVFEGNAQFAEGPTPTWTRGELRLVHDMPERAQRLVAGDFTLPTVGFGGSLPVFGAGIARNFSLQPYLTSRPGGRFEFFLERPSRIEIYVNGTLSQTLQLPAGQQDVRNLPLFGGLNNLQLVITDDLGRVQRLDASQGTTDNALAAGLEQFAYGVGVVAAGGSSRTYDWSQPLVSMFHRRGVTDALTLGGYLQASAGRQLLGTEAIWATPFGNLATDLAFSNAPVGSDFAGRLRYSYARFGPDNPSQRAFHFNLEYRGASFQTFDTLQPVVLLSSLTPLLSLPPAAFRYAATVGYSQKVLNDISASVSTSCQFGTPGGQDSCRLSGGLSKTFQNGLGINLALNYNLGGTSQVGSDIVANLVWSRPETYQSTEVSASASGTRVRWNQRTPGITNVFNSSVGILAGARGTGLDARVNYTGYRAEVGFTHDMLPLSPDGGYTQTSRLTVGTAIAFAGGQFAWTRPITNSFALVAPHPNLGGRLVGVNKTEFGYAARADAIGPAVVPDLPAYHYTRLQVDAPDLPAGYELGPASYHLMPTYKSGTLIRLGTENTVFLRGLMRQGDGQPAALLTGELVSLSDPRWQPATLFTNRIGKFALAGLKPGRYELRLPRRLPLSFEVPDGTDGLYDIGELLLPPS